MKDRWVLVVSDSGAQIKLSTTSVTNTHLQTGDSEVGYESNNFRVVFYFDQLPQLIVALQPREQTTELMVVIRIRQTLEKKRRHQTSGCETTEQDPREAAVSPTCGFANILFTPSTKCERNLARSALLKRDLLTDAI